jgi:UDP-glucose 4-epimerase
MSLGFQRALVTGCAGFIGSHLTEALLAEGVSVVGVDCFNDNYGRNQKLHNLEFARSWDGFEFVPIDLARGELDELVEGTEVVFHLAAEPGVRSSWGPRFANYLRNNVASTQHLLEAASGRTDVRFVYASSSSIYGQAESLPTLESTTPRPYSPYGLTKLAAEHLFDSYFTNFGVPSTSLRFFTVYGPRQRPDMAFRRFCEAAIAGQTIDIYGDGEQSRDFTFVGDIVAAMLSAAVEPGAVGNVFNLGGGSQVSVNDVLRMMEELSSRSLDIRHLAPQSGDVRATSADTTRARTVLGFEPATSFEDGLAEEFDWVANRQRATTSG